MKEAHDLFSYESHPAEPTMTGKRVVGTKFRLYLKSRDQLKQDVWHHNFRLRHS